MLNHVDLCSGIGGFSLGFEWAGLSRPILFCDIEPWSRQILKKHWPDVPIAEDVKELANDPDRFISGRVDILTAGYPCQPFSVAGNQRGTEDPRHIYPYISRIVAHKRPTWCVFENVYGHVSLGLDEVLNDMEGQGYSTRPFIVPASAVNAPHKRDRLWIIARNMADTEGRKSREQTEWQRGEGVGGGSSDSGGNKKERSEAMAYTDNEGSQRRLSGGQSEGWQGELGYSGRSSSAHRQPEKDFWAVEPNVGRVAHGIPRRVDRLKGLGNAIVPQIAQKIGETILKLEKLNEKKNKD